MLQYESEGLANDWQPCAPQFVCTTKLKYKATSLTKTTNDSRFQRCNRNGAIEYTVQRVHTTLLAVEFSHYCVPTF